MKQYSAQQKAEKLEKHYVSGMIEVARKRINKIDRIVDYLRGRVNVGVGCCLLYTSPSPRD